MAKKEAKKETKKQEAAARKGMLCYAILTLLHCDILWRVYNDEVRLQVCSTVVWCDVGYRAGVVCCAARWYALLGCYSVC